MATVPERGTEASGRTNSVGSVAWRDHLTARADAVGVFVYVAVLLGVGTAALGLGVAVAAGLGGVAGAVAFFTVGLLGLAATPTVARGAGRAAAARLGAGR